MGEGLAPTAGFISHYRAKIRRHDILKVKMKSKESVMWVYEAFMSFYLQSFLFPLSFVMVFKSPLGQCVVQRKEQKYLPGENMQYYGERSMNDRIL